MCRKCHIMWSTILRPSSCWAVQKLLKTFSTINSLGVQCKQTLVGFMAIPSNSFTLQKSRGGNPFACISKSHLALCSSQPWHWTPAWQLLPSHFAFDPDLSGWGLAEASTGWRAPRVTPMGCGHQLRSNHPGQRTSSAQLQALHWGAQNSDKSE